MPRSPSIPEEALEASSVFYLGEEESVAGLAAALDAPLPPLRPGEEVEEAGDWEEPPLGSVEEHKGEILATLSRLKLGTDLTRLPFPLFAAQSRSLLEALGDLFANAELLLRAPGKMPQPDWISSI